jgi:hypothetical protein
VAALRSLPDAEVPRRIAFVSDKVFQPSPWVRFFDGFWNSTARLGFATAALLAVAAIAVSRRPVDSKQIEAKQMAVAPVGPVHAATVDTATVDAAVARAVASVRSQDAAAFQATLAAVEQRHKQEHEQLMVAMQESLDVMQKRMGAYTSLASMEIPRENGGQ